VRSSLKKKYQKQQIPVAKLKEKETEYGEKFATPYLAAERGFIDEVIEPAETRRKLIKAFAMLENKVAKRPRRKHGNIPL
jgi:propionyl-CoA carboxylase beta chain